MAHPLTRSPTADCSFASNTPPAHFRWLLYGVEPSSKSRDKQVAGGMTSLAVDDQTICVDVQVTDGKRREADAGP